MGAAAPALFPAVRGSGLRIGLGGAALGNLFEALSDADAEAVVAAAWSDGCRSFDTAPHYGNGLSEHRVGRALRACGGDGAQARIGPAPNAEAGFVLSSKVGRLLLPHSAAPRDQHGYIGVLPFVQRWDYSAAGTRRSVEDSLQRLGLARLSVVYVHDLDAANHGERAPQVLRQVLDQTLPALRRLQQEGLVGAIGLGVNDVAVVQQVLRHADLDALLLAGRHTLIDHSALHAGLLADCVRRGVRIALGGVFNSGILATGVRGPHAATFNYAPATAEWRARTAAIEAVCDGFGVPLRAAALQFPLAHDAVEIVMVGPRSVAQWADCTALMAAPVPAAFWSALRERGLLPDSAPVPGGATRGAGSSP